MPPDPSFTDSVLQSGARGAEHIAIASRRQFAVPMIETEPGRKTPEGAVAGAAIGGVLGAILAGVSTLDAALTLPALDISIAAPWAAALAGGGAGIASGALLGALVGYAMVEERPKRPATPRRCAPSLRRHSVL
jgi:hypothetical protein